MIQAHERSTSKLRKFFIAIQYPFVLMSIDGGEDVAPLLML